MKKTIAQQLNITQFPFEIRDGRGNLIYHERDDGYWIKLLYDIEGKEIYYENTYGEIIDNRPKEQKLTTKN